jgi:hypothetical protein
MSGQKFSEVQLQKQRQEKLKEYAVRFQRLDKLPCRGYSY